MSIHTGESLHKEEVSIGALPANNLAGVSITSDVAWSVEHWLNSALTRDDIYYFCIYWREIPVGQILLHDISTESRESLVAYHLFQPDFRGQGIGTNALSLLTRFVTDHTDLARLIVITSRDNYASQKIAQKCGFIYQGASREDPINEVVFAYNIPRV